MDLEEVFQIETETNKELYFEMRAKIEYWKRYSKWLEVTVGQRQGIIEKVKSAISLAEEWCVDQSNSMTDGSICISCCKDIRRHIKEV